LWSLSQHCHHCRGRLCRSVLPIVTDRCVPVLNTANCLHCRCHNHPPPPTTTAND
jgi:hypothetical protein